MTKKKNCGLPTTSTHMRPDAYNLLTQKKHPAMALCTLLVPEADRTKLDALTGDTSCQSRTMPLLDAAQKIKEYLIKNDQMNDFLLLAREFLRRPPNEKPLKKIRTVEDVYTGKPPPAELENYLTKFRHLIGESHFLICALCYTNSENCIFFIEENGGYFSDITDLDYKVEPIQTDNDSPIPKQLTYDLRAALGHKCTDIIRECALNATTDRFKISDVGSKLKVHLTFEDQLAAAVSQLVSHLPQKDGPSIPLQAIVPQTLVALQNAYRKNHPIYIRIRRVMMTPIEPKEYNCEKSSHLEFNYTLTEARTFMGIPNEETARFKLTSDVPPEQQDTLGMSFDLFSYYVKDQVGESLSSANNDHYYAQIENKNLDPVWALILPSLISHSPFSGYAEHKCMNQDAYYKALCPPAKVHLYDRMQCKGFTLEAPYGEDKRPSLYELITACRQMMDDYDLADIREFVRDETARGAYERRRKPHQAAIRHIRIGSYKEIKAEGENFVHARSAHPEIICRGPLFRMGKRAASFKTIAEVEEFMRIRRSKTERAKRMYKEKYPSNWSFLVATGQVE